MIIPKSYLQNFIAMVLAFNLRKIFSLVSFLPVCPAVLWTRTVGRGQATWALWGGSLCPFSIPHSPEHHLKPQYKHKGISQNEFVFKSHLVTMVPEHGCTEELVQSREGLRALRLRRLEPVCVGFEWHLQGTVFARVLRPSVPCSSHLLCWVLLNLF